jgi:hypothetical protein
MANCVAFNIRHSFRSDTMCVPLGRLAESLDDLNNYITSIDKFIDKYGSSEGVGKEDANAGIIIVNTGKKIIDMSFSQNLGIDKVKINSVATELKNKKFDVKTKFPSTPY